MKITAIRRLAVNLPMKEARPLQLVRDQSFAALDSTVVAVGTDQGVTGGGKVCPPGPAYLPACTEGARTGIADLEQGFTRFQMKLGADTATDITRIRKVADALASGNILAADANCGRKQREAVCVVSAVNDLALCAEKSCESCEQCRIMRDHATHPMIPGECKDSLQAVPRGHADREKDAINLKISRMGGLTRSQLIRDLCVSLGIALTTEGP